MATPKRPTEPWRACVTRAMQCSPTSRRFANSCTRAARERSLWCKRGNPRAGGGEWGEMGRAARLFAERPDDEISGFCPGEILLASDEIAVPDGEPAPHPALDVVGATRLH